MNRKILLVTGLFVLILSACEKLNDLTSFNLDAQTSFTIPGAQTGIGEILSIPRMQVQTSSEQTFKNNNTRADLVKEVYLNKLNLTITAPEQGNFDFLDDIKIYIKAEGEEEVLLASRQNIPEEGITQLELETSGAELSPYIKAESYSLRTDATTDKVIDYDMEVQVDMTFRVTARVF